jgi:hypothetical protein
MIKKREEQEPRREKEAEEMIKLQEKNKNRINRRN